MTKNNEQQHIGGELYLIPTPVGNMEDMTFRAVRLLKEADLILCEDTRTSGLLLKHFDITGKRLMAHHKFNEHGTSKNIIEHLKGGELVCLITDAGTPGISDPGFYLVREAVEAGIAVHTLPGATAFVPALVSSGLPCDKFVFEGFLPQKKGRHTRLQQLAREHRTMIIYESPRRVVKTLTELCEVFGKDRRISASREISKVYEQHVRGTIEEVLAHFTAEEPKGEFVLIVGPATNPKLNENEAAGAYENENETTGAYENENLNPNLNENGEEKPRKLSKYQRKLLSREAEE